MSLVGQLKYHANVTLLGNTFLKVDKHRLKRKLNKPGFWKHEHLGPPLRTSPRLKELISRHYLKGRYADMHQPVAWVTSGAPVEFLIALGYYVTYPENHAAVCGIRRQAEDICGEAEAAGYSRDLCSYARTDIGAALSMPPDSVRTVLRRLQTLDFLTFTKARDGHIQGVRILVPRAAKAREILPDQLRKMGARVDVVDAYKTISPKGDTQGIQGMLEKGTIDMVTFTSSSTVTNFVKMFNSREELANKWMKRVSVACIGPITADTAREQGFSVDLMPADYTIEALTRAITDFFGA